MTAQEINDLIKSSGVDTNGVSDGYHTFGELYNHRIELFITLCRILDGMPLVDGRPGYYVWCSKKHSDGSEYEGWFLLGISLVPGEMITYHLPIKEWDRVSEFAIIRDMAPIWDGHTSVDVLERLNNIR